eukprot:jgi/Mesvir1/13530/Mv16412-RA.1
MASLLCPSLPIGVADLRNRALNFPSQAKQRMSPISSRTNHTAALHYTRPHAAFPRSVAVTRCFPSLLPAQVPRYPPTWPNVRGVFPRHCTRASLDGDSRSEFTSAALSARDKPLRAELSKLNGLSMTSADSPDSPSSNPVVTEPEGLGWRKRWTIVGLCFAAFLLCNMDRVNMSIAILPMAEQYGWDSATVGVVQSSFFWGYLLTQIAGGVWADRIGGKAVLSFGVVWWSVATMATPWAAEMGLPALLACRACMGIGEGVAMPAMSNIVSRWVPASERSRSLALIYSGMFLGSVTGLLASPGLIESFGWPSVFTLFGSVGALWFTAWTRAAASCPAECDNIHPDERRFILSSVSVTAPVRDVPWALLLSRKEVWAIILAHFCHNWGTFILLTWMPTYYTQVLGFNLFESGIYSVLPWLLMAISSNAAGALADGLVSRGTDVTTVRKAMQTVGFLGPALFLTLLRHVDASTPMLAVLCMMGSQGTDAFSQSGLYSNHQDIGPRYAGVLLGMSNTAGVLAGVIGTAVTGMILREGSWDDVFSVSIALYLVGTLVWLTLSTGKRVFD